MELREYMSVRRAYNLVRQGVEAQQRVTFSEFAILCRLALAQGPVRTSDIASYQGSLRPTMTHRTKHLSKLGLITRDKGSEDKRNVVCGITDAGRAYVDDLCSRTCDEIGAGQALARTTPERICRYVDAMGAVSCTASDLTLLGLAASDNRTSTVSGLVDVLGLLQPTVSMSVTGLAKEGLVAKASPDSERRRSVDVTLTNEGAARVAELEDQIEQVVVRRKPRRSKAAADAAVQAAADAAVQVAASEATEESMAAE